MKSIWVKITHPINQKMILIVTVRVTLHAKMVMLVLQGTLKGTDRLWKVVKLSMSTLRSNSGFKDL